MTTPIGQVPHVESGNTRQIRRRMNQTIDQVNALTASQAPSTPLTSISVTQAVVTSSRAFSTSYQNNGSSALFVAVSVQTPGSVGGTATAHTGATTGGLAVVAIASAVAAFSGSANAELFFLVPPGWYYEVTYDVNLSIICWTEWTVTA